MELFRIVLHHEEIRGKKRFVPGFGGEGDKRPFGVNVHTGERSDGATRSHDQ